MSHKRHFGLLKGIIVVAVCFVTSARLSAQNAPSAGFGIEANILAGKVIKHTAKFKAPVPDLSTAFDLNFVQKTWGKKPWHQRRGYPVAGFGIGYTNYGIDSIYGRSVSVYPNIQFPLITGKKIEWTFRVGFGLAYTTRHYERGPIWDTLNTAIGSHFNNYTLFMTDLRYHVNKHLDIQLGANFSHMSNAAYKQPNLGINMYGAHIGIRYFPVTSTPEKIQRKLIPVKNRWLVQARIGLSLSEAGYTDGPSYPIYLASVYASRRWRGKNKMFAGIDYSYHKKIEAFLKNNEIFPGEEKKHSYKSAVFVGNEFMFGRVGILLQVGYYIKDAALKLDPYYEKLGGNLYLVQKEKGILKETFLSILLKTHKTQAELVEVGLGVGF